MVGRTYSERLDPQSFAKQQVVELSFEGLEAIGLRFDPEGCRIEGTPIAEGNYTVTARYRVAGNSDELHSKECPLLINPDPRSLWKNIDSDRNDPFWRVDERCDRVVADDRCFVLASKRGRSHAHEGKFRDDDYALLTGRSDGWSFIALADGAGSARFARRGAELACNTSTAYLASYLPTVPDSVLELAVRGSVNGAALADDSRKALTDILYNSLGRAAFSALKRIQEEAQEVGAAVRDFSTTLLVVAYKRLRVGHFFGSFWVGDGGMAIYRGNGSVLSLGHPDGGQFAGQTRFVTMPEVFEYTELMKRLRFAVIDDFTALVMMTDGVTDPKFQTESNLQKGAKWDELWNELSSAVKLDRTNEHAGEELLRWLDFWSPGNHDDRTIALML